MARKYFILLFALVFCHFAALPLAADDSDPEFMIDTWDTEQGLPQSSVTSIVQTPDGYLWFGTFQGLVRFDGIQFDWFHRLNTPELPSNGIVNLHFDRQGRLWISTLEGTVCLRDGKWTQYTPGRNWVGKYVRFFSETHAGRLYVVTWTGELARRRGDGFEALPPPPVDQTRGIFPYLDEQGELVAVCPEFVGKLVEGKWVETIPAATWKNEHYEGSGFAGDGGLWILTDEKLRKYRNGQLISDYPGPEVNGSKDDFGVWRILEDSHGAVWVCTMKSGLYRFSEEGGWRHFTTANGLANDSIRTTFEDREGNLWVGTDGGGLQRFRPRVFQAYKAQKGLEVNTVSADRQGNVYIGTLGQGLMKFDGTKFNPVQNQSSTKPPELNIVSLLFDRQDRLWIGMLEKGLSRMEGGRIQKVTDNLDAGNITIESLFEDSQGKMWVGHDRGIYCFDNGKVKKYQLESSFQFPLAHGFAEDPDTGTVWSGAVAPGLFHLEDNQFRPASGTGLPSGESVTSLLRDNDGTLWVGTAHSGLACLRSGNTFTISEKHGLPGGNIGAILDDGLGSLWLSTTRGIFRAPRDELERVIGGQSPALVGQLFDLKDGLPSVDCTGGQPCSCKDSQGRLWFATSKGAARTDPSKLPLNLVPPLVNFRKVLIDSRLVMSEQRINTSANVDLPVVTVPAGSKRIEIHYAGMSLSVPEKVRYSYRLEGLDNTWVDVGNQRIAFINDLKPGRYRFRVRAANNDWIWNEFGSALELEIQPFLWQTPWFLTLAILGVIGMAVWLGWLITRSRLRRQFESLQHQNALHREQARLASVLEATSDLVAFADREGRLLYLNGAGRRMAGLNPNSELNGRTMADLHPSRIARDVLQKGISSALAQGIWSGDTTLLHQDGREIPLSQVIAVHKNKTGEVDFLSTIARDITDRKRHEEELLRSQHNYETLVNTMDGVVWEADAQTLRFTFVSPQAERLLGYPPERWTEAPLLWSERIVAEDREHVVASYRAATKDKCDQDLLYRMTASDGREVWVHDRVKVVMEKGQVTALRGVMVDVTQQKQLEEQFRQAQKMEAVGSLAGGVAHDFNNLLTVIMGYSDMLLGSLPPEDSTFGPIKEIQSAGLRASELTKQLLAFSRRQILRPTVLNLNTVVSGVQKMLNRLIGEHITQTCRLDPQLGLVKADLGQVEQVIVNLAVNARDAMPRGGHLTIEKSNVELEFSDSRRHPDLQPGQYVMLAINDTGCGMDAETQSHIFEPFFTTKDVGQGTGLGLATVYGIIKHHGGHITVQSEPGRGSTFKAYLPRIKEARPAREADISKSPSPGGRETILLVEDDDHVRKLTAEALRGYGYNVLEAANGPEALKVWDQNEGSLNLLVTDVVMPHMNGRELSIRLKALHPGLKVLYISGYVHGKTLDLESLDKGMDFIQKPFTPDDIARCTRELLDKA
jgi:PAS domain S-box-containing protein